MSRTRECTYEIERSVVAMSIADHRRSRESPDVQSAIVIGFRAIAIARYMFVVH